MGGDKRCGTCAKLDDDNHCSSQDAWMPSHGEACFAYEPKPAAQSPSVSDGLAQLGRLLKLGKFDFEVAIKGVEEYGDARAAASDAKLRELAKAARDYRSNAGIMGGVVESMALCKLIEEAEAHLKGRDI